MCVQEISRRSPQNEAGVALIVVLLTTTLLLCLGGGLALLSATEARVAAHHLAAIEAFYAAEGGITRVLPDLLGPGSWDTILAGAVRSTFVDGDPSGLRTLVNGKTIDLIRATAIERCGLAAGCADGDLVAVSEERPYGANNPTWQLYAYGPITDMASAAGPWRSYVVVWVGDDPLETDDDPLRDAPAGPGHDRLTVRARAFAPFDTERVVEAVIARDAGRLRIVSWREL